MVGPGLHLWRWYSLSFPLQWPSRQASTLPRSYFLSTPFRSAAECLPLKFKWQEPTKRGLFRDSALRAARLSRTSIQSTGSSCFLFFWCWRAVLCRSPFRVREHFPGLLHSASFIQSGSAWRRTASALSHFHGQPWNWKINKHTLPLQCLLTLFLEKWRMPRKLWAHPQSIFIGYTLPACEQWWQLCSAPVPTPSHYAVAFKMLCSTWKSRSLWFHWPNLKYFFHYQEKDNF